MAKKGDLIEFKPGLFGLSPPNNLGIFIKQYRNKQKVTMVEVYTLNGTQQTKQENLGKKKFNKSLQLIGDRLPESKTMKKRLEIWIKEISYQNKKLQESIANSGELNIKDLWQKLLSIHSDASERSFNLDELIPVWYGLDKSEISKNQVKKFKEIMNRTRTHGVGYFDLNGKNSWKPISDDMRKAINNEINLLGTIKNKMFHVVEVPVIDSEDPEETEMVRMPKNWDDISFSFDENQLLNKIQQMMKFFIENDAWRAIGMGDTYVFELDGFSLRNYISYLAEDWINEGRTSYSDSFVKFLLRTKFWSDTEALLAISKRIVNLAENFDWETDERIEKIASGFKEPKENPQVFMNRLDLQKLEAYTIDPPTAKDFDDAISLEIKSDEYILWVHIADVSYYVEKNSTLDLHARRRATSVYLPTKTLPMLPTHLSDNLCSLNENIPRLAMTVEIHYDMNGKRILEKSKIHNSVIMVTKNLTYDFVNKAISKQKEPFYSYHKFSLLINKHRKGLMLETDDVRLELGGQMELSIKTSSPSTKMIESFMVAANETVAEILQKNKVPVIYRNHPLPDKEDVKRFNVHAEVIGLDFNITYPNLFEEDKKEKENSSILDLLSENKGKGNISFSFGSGELADQLKSQLSELEEQKSDEVDLGTPMTKGLAQLNPEKREEILKPFRNVLQKIENISDEYDRKMGYLIVLRTLSRALYNAANIGHFGLGSTGYIHFTSPIRRYPDVIAHRVCKALIAKQEYAYSADEIEELAFHCTEQSIVAEKLERNIIGAGFSFLTRNPNYTENKLGIVTSISGGGVFVTLPNGIEARIPLSKMTDRPTFVDDYESMCFIGTRSKFKIDEELTPQNYKTILGDSQDDPVEVVVKLGEKIAIEFIGWNHIDGKVEAQPVRIITED